ncbi:4'-phosphopantetheinyl transferase superfamily protein [Fibrella sp. WM1]|uniref:4'-phosphopantetheinyl transferase family protein n=1 Tax=Fibrella musci TaxID=3242485 RepID=UPI003522F165
MICLYYVKFDGVLSAPRFTEALRSLPGAMQQQVVRFRYAADQHRSLYGKLLLRYALRQQHLPDSWLGQVSTGAYQRPQLNALVDFNISHSGDVVLCGLATEGTRIGVDVEEMKPIDWRDFEAIWRPDEWAYITGGGSAQQMTRFYTCWTQKEAIMKADGRGMSLPVQQIWLDQATLTAQVGLQRWQLVPLTLAEGYQAHLATNKVGDAMRVQAVNVDQLLDEPAPRPILPRYVTGGRLAILSD